MTKFIVSKDNQYKISDDINCFMYIDHANRGKHIRGVYTDLNKNQLYVLRNLAKAMTIKKYYKFNKADLCAIIYANIEFQ